MISKFVNWNWKINKYLSKLELENFQPGYKRIGVLNNEKKTYWDYYLNYLTPEKVLATFSSPVPTTPYEAQFVSFQSFKRQYTDEPGNSGVVVNKENLFQPSIAKTASFPKYEDLGIQYAWRSGFRATIKADTIGDATRLRHFNAIAIQLNKLDKAYIDQLSALNVNGNIRYIFEYTKKTSDSNSPTATNSITKRVIFQNVITGLGLASPYTESVTISGNTSSTTVTEFKTNIFKVENGLFFIDYEILKQLGFDKDGMFYKEATGGYSVEQRHYHFNFYIASSDSEMPQLQVSHITFTNSFDVYLDDIKFNRKNLTNFNIAKKTGIAFPEINEYQKSLDSSMRVLNISELLNFDINMVKNNMNTPFFFFPYSIPSDALSLSASLTDAQALRYKVENAEMGGLYFWDTSFDITNTDYNLFDIPVKLDEYK